MSEEMELGSGEVQAVRDLKLGIRARRTWSKILAVATQHGLSETQVRGFVTGGGLFATDDARKSLTTSLDFDWDSAAEFFATIAPIIMEMMASCGV
jgi:hypothetical protein